MRASLIAVLGFGAFGLLGCAQRPPEPEEPIAQVDDAYADALEHFRAGRYAEAADGFRAYLDAADDPASPDALAALAYVVLAEVARGDCAAAEIALGALTARDTRGALAPDAEAAVKGCTAGLAIPTDVAGAEAVLERVLAGGTPLQIVVAANRLVALGGKVSDDVRAAVTKSVDSLPDGSLADVWPLLDPKAFPAPLVAYRRVAAAVQAGDLAAARVHLAEITDGAVAKRARVLIDRAANLAKVDARVVGVLLPLSGKYKAVGRELRKAIELAADGDAGLKLVFADTAGDPAKAVAAVDKLVADAHPIVLLGPVGVRESAAAVARAVELRVPIAVLAPSEGLADPAAGVFRLVSSAEDRARSLARAAIDRGYEAPAVLAPADELGRAQAAAFAAEMQAAGVELVLSGEYDPAKRNLEPAVKAFLNLDPAKNERLRKHLRKRGRKEGWKTFSPDIDFDILFIPDEAGRAALIAAFLVYFNVELRTGESKDPYMLRRKHGGRLPSIVQLLGGAGWHTASFLARGGADVDGALLGDVFVGGDGEDFASDTAADFAARWEERAGRPPSAAAAQAYDAARLTFDARRRAAAEKAPRFAMAAALAGAVLEDGACGRVRVGADGELQPTLYVLQVESGRFVLQDLWEDPSAP